VIKPIVEPQFATIRRNAVAGEAIKIVKQMIVRGDLTAGQRLPSERDLAAQLGVSRPSLREAIRALIALNILESRHGEGTFVSSLEPELLSEPIDFVLHVNSDALYSLFEARRVLEAGIAALAAERATDLELAELDDFAALGRTRLKDADSFIEHDIEFHSRLRDAARSPVLASLLSSVSALSIESRRITARQESVRSRALADHVAMVKALKGRDPRAASELMAAHLEHVSDGLKRALAETARKSPAR
jgi:GntR family transcriptional regulator, transcriptional repressor for pyruvate dehydrogenase complex